jgi:hypothetical protein
MEGLLDSQRFKGLGCNVQVVDVHGVQSHLKAEPAEPIEQAIGAPLRGGRSHPQDQEMGTIQYFSLLISFSY